jgi:2-amino-4-hydroxy-6-hydroxymethyldihydropteridine diphosphokinase
VPRRAFLGLGSNIGDREESLRAAVAGLRAADGVNFLRQSRVYRTEAMYVAEQPEFLNMVVEVEVGDDISARHLLELVKGIEQDIGRRRRERWGPREIDIDILLFGDERIADDDFEVPHPRMWERAFVMAPLAELAPDLRSAGGETAAELAERLRREQRVSGDFHL